MATRNFSDIIGSPQVVPITPVPTNYVPSFAGMGTVTGINVNWSQSGTRCKVWGTFKTGTPTAAPAKMTLPVSPAALNINTSWYVQGDNVLGYGTGNGASAAGVMASGTGFALVYDSSDNTDVFFSVNTDTTANDRAISAQNGNVVFNVNARVVFSFEYEISGAIGVVAQGAGAASSTKYGLVKDRKEYLSGTAYTNGTPTATGANSGSSTVRGVFVPYQTIDGAWRMTFNIATSFTAGATVGQTIAISGVTFKNISNYNQPCAGIFGGVTIGNFQQAYANPNTSNIVMTQTSGSSTNFAGCSGDVELDSKPTWAD